MEVLEDWLGDGLVFPLLRLPRCQAYRAAMVAAILVSFIPGSFADSFGETVFL
jgi:hypothetical protein